MSSKWIRIHCMSEIKKHTCTKSCTAICALTTYNCTFLLNFCFRLSLHVWYCMRHAIFFFFFHFVVLNVHFCKRNSEKCNAHKFRDTHTHTEKKKPFLTTKLLWLSCSWLLVLLSHTLWHSQINSINAQATQRTWTIQFDIWTTTTIKKQCVHTHICWARKTLCLDFVKFNRRKKNR